MSGFNWNKSFIKCKGFYFYIQKENVILSRQVRRFGKKNLLLHINHPDKGIREMCRLRLGLSFEETAKEIRNLIK